MLEDTDLEALSDLSHVSGYIQVSMGMRAQPDLSFLGCLESVDYGLIIRQNGALETTAGLGRLTKLSNLEVSGNGSLAQISGFDALTEIGLLDVSSNPVLGEIQLHSVESVARLNIGYCMGMGADISGNATLAALDGFSSLAHVGDLRIPGNQALASARVLDALVSNEAAPLGDVEIMWNEHLPETDVNAKLDRIGVVGVRTVCGNAGGVPSPCDCGIE